MFFKKWNYIIFKPIYTFLKNSDRRKKNQKNFGYLPRVNYVVLACFLMYNEYSNQYDENRFPLLLEIDEMCLNKIEIEENTLTT